MCIDFFFLKLTGVDRSSHYCNNFQILSESTMYANTNVTTTYSALENQRFAYAKTKTQIRFAVTAKLISAFVFAT